MQMILRSAIEQIRNNWVRFLMLYLFGLGLLSAIVLAGRFLGVPVSYFTYDPASVAHLPFYIGFLSNLGILLWCLAALPTGLTYYLLRGTKNVTLPVDFFAYASALSAWLLFDDFFMLHERVFPEVLHIDEDVVMAAYFIALLIFIFRYARLMLNTDYLPFLTTLFFFAVSIFIDLLPKEHLGDLSIFFEDGAKFLGVLSWSYYFFTLSVNTLRKALARSLAE